MACRFTDRCKDFAKLVALISCVFFTCVVRIEARGLHHHRPNAMLFVPQPFDDNRAIAASLMRRTRADAAGPYVEPLANERERAVEMMRHGLRMRNAKQASAAAAAAGVTPAPSVGSHQITTTSTTAAFKSDDGDNVALFSARQAGLRPTLSSATALREFLSGLKSRLQAGSTIRDADSVNDRDNVRQATSLDENNWNNLAAFDGVAGDDAEDIESQLLFQQQQQQPIVAAAATAGPLPAGKSQEILGRLRDLVSSRDRPVTDDMARFRYAIAG